MQGQTKRGDLGLNDFFKLMVTQLKNQDPMKPLENGEFLSQIAQFGTVSGIDKLNKTFEGLAANLTSGQAIQAGNLIGREVLVPGGVAALAPGQPSAASSSSTPPRPTWSCTSTTAPAPWCATSTSAATRPATCDSAGTA